ncbi:MAG: primosomal protein N' [Lysobacterales bacterium]
MTRVLQVALPLPTPQLYDYLPADAAPVAVGARVRVPLGRRELVGIVVATADSQRAPDQLRRVLAVLDPGPAFPAELWDSLLWAAGYWHYPLGEVLAAALPVRLRDPAERPAPRHDDFALRLEPAPGPRPELRPGSAGAALLAALAEGPRPWRELRAEIKNAASGLRRLEQLRLVSRIEYADSPRQALTQAPPLNADQTQAVASVAGSLGRFQTFLLDGVTGSGKTEVYLALIEQVLARGQQALVLVPEIGLTPQLLARFRERLPAPVLAQHSDLAAGERARVWQRVQTSAPLVLIGTRSAVFAPLARPGLIVIDEEHDASLKQHEGFRYHARDLALVRARRLGIPVLLGSATPALESLHNVARARYHHLPLPARAGFARPPAVSLVDLRRQTLAAGLCAPVLAAISAHLERDEQVLVFKNRRGFSPLLQCRACGWHAECDRCDRPYTLHRKRQRLVCHPCGRERPVPLRCPVCGERPTPIGFGTERLEEGLAAHFPQVPILRADRDSVRGRDGLARLLAPAVAGESCILVGTQMLAKGHDLARLTLAIVVDADASLCSQDYRASERMAQLIVQVAGRAGRGQHPGQVLIQTRHPEHPLFAALLDGGYPAFAEAELALRQQLDFPPFTAQALLAAEASDEARLRSFFEVIGPAIAAAQVRAIGPMPASQPRRAGQTRWQLLLQASDRRQLQSALPQLLATLYRAPESKRVRWSLDVDPLGMD